MEETFASMSQIVLVLPFCHPERRLGNLPIPALFPPGPPTPDGEDSLSFFPDSKLHLLYSFQSPPLSIHAQLLPFYAVREYFTSVFLPASRC